MRQRYDTTAFVNELIKTRRKGILLVMVGLVIVGALVAGYLLMYGTPDVPLPQRALVAAHPQAQVPISPPAPTTATLNMTLAKKGLVWVDNEAVGPVPISTHEADLTPGKHTLKVKMGAKILSVMLTVKEGETYTVTFDPKKAKPEIKKEE